mmetsp:Transcript_74079/g.140960  ORF Transcript_74079/g.140960 Transcript_74079/m.140960 type:complete len:304 (+) Transcript_74079:1213-2124(+)
MRSCSATACSACAASSQAAAQRPSKLCKRLFRAKSTQRSRSWKSREPASARNRASVSASSRRPSSSAMAVCIEAACIILDSAAFAASSGRAAAAPAQGARSQAAPPPPWEALEASPAASLCASADCSSSRAFSFLSWVSDTAFEHIFACCCSLISSARLLRLSISITFCMSSSGVMTSPLSVAARLTSATPRLPQALTSTLPAPAVRASSSCSRASSKLPLQPPPGVSPSPALDPRCSPEPASESTATVLLTARARLRHVSSCRLASASSSWKVPTLGDAVGDLSSMLAEARKGNKKQHTTGT